MENLTMDTMEQKLDTIIAALSAENLDYDEIEYDWYGEILNQDSEGKYLSEVDLAEEAIKYPELHEKMREIVRLLTKINDHANSYAVWEDEQAQAGGAFASELAIANREDIVPYARYVSTNDLNHEVDQQGNMIDIVGAWGWNKDTYAVLAARWFTPGQFREEFMMGGLTEEIIDSFDSAGAVDDFLEVTARWFTEEWFRWYTAEKEQESIEELFEQLLPDKFDLDEESLSQVTARFVSLVMEKKIPKWSDLLV